VTAARPGTRARPADDDQLGGRSKSTLTPSADVADTITVPSSIAQSRVNAALTPRRVCDVCGWVLDPVIIAQGWTAHPCCELDCRPLAELQAVAYRRYRAAIRSGRLVPDDECAHCGVMAGRIRHAGHHHNGYGPGHELDVIWLCPADHARAHQAPR
jgi:hypothetical protein